jgi:hypothetical protein
MISREICCKKHYLVPPHGMFLKGVYKIESNTKTEYEGF